MAGSDSQRNIKWIDGLRGIASFMVIMTHLARAWDTDLFIPRSSEDATPRLLQLPIFRIPGQGRIGVTIFAFLTGYVCALKPIKQIRSGNPEAALVTVARSSFRRVPRLVFPQIIATFIAWLLCQMGAFEVAHRTDSWWIDNASPYRSETFGDAIWQLIHNTLGTWVSGHNSYDDHQWTLFPLLKAAFLVFLTISATAFMQPRYRMITVVFLYWYAWINGEATFATQVYFAMFLCEMNQDSTVTEFLAKRRLLTTIACPIIVFLGLFVASYPGGRTEWSIWSKNLEAFGHIIFPANADFGRFYSGIGLQLVALGVQYWQGAKDFLSNKYFLWFGKVSFAVYLIHGTLLRTVLTMFLYGFVPTPFEQKFDDKGEPIPPPPMHMIPKWTQWITVPLWFVIVYSCAYLWTTYVDAWCAKLSKKLEAMFFEETEKSAPLLGPR